MSLDSIRRILVEWYGKDSFNMLLEAVLSEGIVRLHDWETDPKFKYDHEGNPADYRQVAITPQDFVNINKPGHSISKSNYIFMPVDFALTPMDGAKMVSHVADLLKNGESVTITGLPGFGIEGDKAYAARWYKTFTAEDKSVVQDQFGKGLVVTAINGEPLSRWLTKPSSIDMDTSSPGSASKSFWGGKVPDWLSDLSAEIDEAVRNGKVNVERARLEGFQGDLVLSTPKGDSVLLISKDPSHAAYIIRKKIDNTDWDAWLNKTMKELIAKYSRRSAGTKKEDIPNVNLAAKRQPKLLLRDLLSQNKGGYALRRAIGPAQGQQMRDEIKRLINNGVNYADGQHLADA